MVAAVFQGAHGPNSAEGAEYNSQGQARSASPLVRKTKLWPSPEGA